MSFRAERADSGKVYRSSDVAASMFGTSGTLCLQSGVIDKILELSLSHAAAPAVFFFVRWYRAELVGPDPKCSNVMLIKASATVSPWTRQSAVVSAEKVVKQVCLSQVPDIISMGSSWVWVLHYETSSFLTAPHLLQGVASLELTAWSELLLYMIR